MSVTKTALLLAAAAITLAVVVHYFLSGGVPAGQPPLADITITSLDSL